MDLGAADKPAGGSEAVTDSENPVGAFLAETERFIRRHDLLPEVAGGPPGRPGQAAAPGVLVAVSGGPDSVALAAAMRLLGGWALQLGHVHHGLRAGADADADFVAALARKWNLPFHLERIDTPVLAQAWHVGVEEAARRGRYDALVAMAERVGASVVATGHHADDQVETILHRIVRGTHLRGLAGMPPLRRLTGSVGLIRPLLWARRDQIERFCRAQELPWRTDETNAATDLTRNFLRHELLPLLRRRLNVRADEALLRLAESAAEAESALEELAGRLFERACRKRSAEVVVLRAAPLKKAPGLLASLAFRRALLELSAPEGELTQRRFKDLLALLEGPKKAIDLPGGLRAEAAGRDVRIRRRSGSD